MNSFLLLVKINLTQLFVGSFSVNNNSKKKRIMYSILFGVLFLYIAFTFGYMAYEIGMSLTAINMQKILIIMAFLISSVMIFMQVFFSAFNILFKTKDYEQLASLPIKQITIILSKLVSFLIFCYVFSAVFFIPISVMYFVFQGFNLIGLMFTIFGYLLLPLFPMFIGILFSFLINALTVRLKSKNIINLIIFFTLFVAIFLLSQKTNDIILNVINNSQTVYNSMLNIYFPNIFIGKAIIYSDFLNFVFYVLISVVPVGLLTWLFSWKYKKINSFFSQSAKTKNVKYVAKSNNVTNALLRKEFTRLFSSPMILLNTCIGPIMLIIFAIMSFGDVYSQINSLYNGFILILIIVPATNFLANPTSSTFSLEGKNFWLLKNLPIKLKDIIMGKILAMFIIFVVPNVIGIVLLSIALKLSILEILIMSLLCLVSIILSALIGLIINLKKCNINWSNEILVVKQSASALINLVIGMAISILPTIIYIYLLQSFVHQLIYGAILVVFYICFIFILSFYLKKHAKNLFGKIY